MPYITQEDRLRLHKEFHKGDLEIRTSGELNYVLTETIILYLTDKQLSYNTINDIVGALESCKQEFYRRVAVPYENDKILLNGDVYK